MDVETALGEHDGVAAAGTAEVEHARGGRIVVRLDEPEQSQVWLAPGEALNLLLLLPKRPALAHALLGVRFSALAA